MVAVAAAAPRERARHDDRDDLRGWGKRRVTKPSALNVCVEREVE